MMKRSSWLTLAIFLTAASPVRGEFLITEVMADNRTSLQDQDKDYSDWIEIINAGEAEASLDGYFLSNDPLKPDRWQFPAVTLPPGRFLVVFASGKNRRDPASELHTGFKLGKEGGKLTLSAPDRTPVDSLVFPEAAPNMSYGAAMETSSVRVVDVGAPVRVLVPADASLGADWIAPEFDDSLWREGVTGVGYGLTTVPLGTDVETEMKGKNSSVFIRIPFDIPSLAAVDFVTFKVSYDDGFVAFLNGEDLAAKNVPTTIVWNSRSTANHAPDIVDEIDVTPQRDLLRQGRNVLAIQVLNRLSTDTDCFILPQIDLVSLIKVHKETPLYFPAPTAGRPNGTGFPAMTPRPIFSQPSKAFPLATPPNQITISTDLAGASIRYTLDSTRPRESSTLYTAPIDITGTVKITARVFMDGFAPGIAEGRVYTVLAKGLETFRSNLPLVICSTLGTSIAPCGGDAYSPGVAMVLVPGPDGTRLTDEAVFSDSTGFRRRGSSTCNYEKLAFNFQIWDEERVEKQVPVLDFPEDSDFVMHGSTNYDRGLMHNPLAYWMSREVGQWAPRTQWVECFFQSQSGPMTSTNYFGVYAFMEKNKRGPERVDVEALTPQDNKEPRIAGGYILKRDRASGTEVVIGGGGYSLVMVEPKQPTAAQRAWISGYINKAVAALSPNIGKQEDTDAIEVPAWIDHHILCWYPKNVDAFRLSGYMFKTRGGGLAMGPVWDYDRSMGGADDNRAITPEGWYNDNVADGGTQYFASGGMGSWYSILFQGQPPTGDTTPWNKAYRARWRELRRGPLKTDHIEAQIDQWADEIRDAYARNTQRWGSIQAPTRGGFQGEVDWLKTWLRRRAVWIDAQFLATPQFSQKGGLVNPGLQLEIKVESDSQIYYTLDGADPKSGGVNPSPTAVLYAGPITIDRNMRVSARALEGGNSWSSLVKDTYLVEIAKLTLTEIMYSPPPPTTAEDPDKRFQATQMKFVELKNVGQKTVDLRGFRFTRGPSFNFTTSAVDHLDPGGILVLVSFPDAFKARYGSQGIAIAGQFASLGEQGGRITLQGPVDETVLDFNYSSTWYPETKGGGYSLVNADPTGAPETLGNASRWHSSLRPLGTPGADEAASGRQRPGDLTGDAKLTVGDAIYMILRLTGGALIMPCDGGQAGEAANAALLDWNGDRALDISDAVGTLSYLFLAGPQHALGTVCVRLEGCPEGCR